MNRFHVPLVEAIQQLSEEATQKFTTLMRHGSMSVEYFSPGKVDTQTPHSQDEIYIIAKGSGTFVRDNHSLTFNAGDVLFVPAGMEHHFENFTEDFATWVIFYGADGGEKNSV